MFPKQCLHLVSYLSSKELGLCVGLAAPLHHIYCTTYSVHHIAHTT